MKLLKYENSKLKNQFIFNLPVSKSICGRVCKGCYALKPQLRFPTTVLPSREAKYEASTKDSFTTEIVQELTKTRRKARIVRIHESGEFYSQDYIQKWEQIAKALPQFTFYAFTKRLKDFDFSAIKKLDNVVIIDSLQFGVLNYAKIETIAPLAKKTGARICPATGCGTTCNYCMTKEAQNKGVLFERH